VAKTGNDSNAGTSSLPCLTINHGITLLTPGDTCFVKVGTYQEYVHFFSSGTVGHPIVLKNYGTDVVTIDAQSTRVYCLYAADQSYITIDGINILNSTAYNLNFVGCNNVILKNMVSTAPVNSVTYGFEVTGDSNWADHFTLQNLTAVGGGYCIWLTGKVSNTTVTNCEVSQAKYTGLEINVDNVTIPSGPQLLVRPRSIVVDGVYSHNNTIQGISMRIAQNITVRNSHSAYNGATGIQIEAYTDTVLVENNICEFGSRSYTYETGIWLYLSNHATIRKNILRNNQTGLRVSGGSSSFQIYYNLIYNNNYSPGGTNQSTSGVDFSNAHGTFYDNTLYGNCASNSQLAGLYFYPDTSTVDLKNNIIMNSGGAKDMTFLQMPASIVTSDYNIVYNANRATSILVGSTSYSWSGYKIASSQDVHSVNSDPLFEDSSNTDFKLLTGSPAVNAGVNVGLTTDYLGNLIKSSPDIGAYEQYIIYHYSSQGHWASFTNKYLY
jgi:hypothetical protein